MMGSETIQRRFTTVDNRYQVGDDHNGFDSGWPSLREAIEAAIRLACHLKSVVYIYDVMAHRGCKTEWKVTQDGHVMIVGRRSAVG